MCKGEVPLASHLLYTQLGILDDRVLEERVRGVNAEKSIIEELNVVMIVYTDLGISKAWSLE